MSLPSLSALRSIRSNGGRTLRWRWLSLRAHVVALLLAAYVEVTFRLVPVDRLARHLGTPLDRSAADGPLPPELDLEDLSYRQWLRVTAIDRIYRWWPFGDTCLRRSLAWGRVLRGRSPRLRIGVARGDDGLVKAHSWLEFDGRCLGSSTELAYETLGR